MTKKQLISEQDVRSAFKRGEHTLYANEKNTLITDQAYSVAKDLGLSIHTKITPAPEEVTHSNKIMGNPSLINAATDDTELIRQEIAAQTGGNVDQAVFAEVMQRIKAQQHTPNTVASPSPLIEAPPSKKRTSTVAAPFIPHTLDDSTKHHMKLIKTCEEWASLHSSRVVFPDAMDDRALLAAAEIQGRGWGTPILLADTSKLRRYCESNRTEMPHATIINPEEDSPKLEAYIQALHTRRPELSKEDARKQLMDPLWYAAMMLVCGDADYCIGGNLSATASVLKAALRVIGLSDGIRTLSSMFFMISPDGSRVLGFGDCAVVPEPTSEQLADIAISTASNFQQVTGQIPRVAMLSFSTKGSAKHATVEHIAKAVALVKARAPELLIDGELQFDAAIVKQVATLKAPNSLVAGKANVFIFPSLAAGNIAYKVAERLGGYTALGPMIQGLRLPMHDLSRGCSSEDMIQVALLAMKMTPHNTPTSPNLIEK